MFILELCACVLVVIDIVLFCFSELATSKEVDSKLNPNAIPVFFPTTDNHPNINTTKEIHSNLNPEAIPVFYPHHDASLQTNVIKNVQERNL